MRLPVPTSALRTTVRGALVALLAAASIGMAGRAGAQTPPPTEYRLDPDWIWSAAKAPAPGSDADMIARARRELAEERPGAARSLLDGFIDKYEKTSNVMLPQAYFYRGDAISAGGNEFKALYDYETVIKDYPQSPEYSLAVERELEIAVRYVNGLDRKFLGIRFLPANDIGEELLIRVHERMPGSRLAERAIIELADHYYRMREMEAASEAYDAFIRNFPNSQYRMKAMQRRVYASIARYKGPRYDSRPLVDSQVLIKRFMLQYPAQAEQTGLDESLLARIDESGALQLLQTARWYMRRGDHASARYTLKRLIAKHPRTSAAEQAIDLCVKHGWMPMEPEQPAAATPSESSAASAVPAPTAAPEQPPTANPPATPQPKTGWAAPEPKR